MTAERLELLADLRLDAAHPVPVQQQPLGARLADSQIRRGFHHPLHPRPIRRLIRLRATRPDGRPLAGVEKAKLDSGRIDRQRHLAAQRVDLPHQMALADPADRRIARHLPDMVQVERQHQASRAHPRSRQRRLNPGMPSPDNDYVVVHNDLPIMPRARIAG